MIGFVITLLTFILNLFACIISFIVLICIMYRHFYGRIKKQKQIILILHANIYLYLFLYVTIHIIFNIYTILGDIYGINFDSSLCIFRGYFMIVLLSCLYYGFVVQVIINSFYSEIKKLIQFHCQKYFLNKNVFFVIYF